MSQIDPSEKAAECARMIEATTDPHTREVLTNLRNLWVHLANESRLLTNDELAEQIKAISQIHAGIMPPTIN
jgi:hypothetical protein